MRLLLSQGKRKTASGWLHFRCPFCPLKGFGSDPSFHLGVKIGTRIIKCFRCGTERLPPGWAVEGQPPASHRTRKVLMPKRKSDYPPSSIGNIPCPWAAGWSMVMRKGARPVSTHRGTALLFTFPETEGYQLRFLDGNTPKVHSTGLSGPLWLWPGRPRESSRSFFVVEGWGDGLPMGDRSTLALLGASTTKAAAGMLSPSSNMVPLLFLDGDEVGRKAQASLARLLLRRGWREVGWLCPPPGKKDPGEMTTAEVDALSIRWVTDLKTLRACEEMDRDGA